MKNPIILSNRSETLDYVNSLWKSDYFKENKDAFYRTSPLMELFCANPRIFCDYTDSSIEHTHFYAWMNIIPHRDYYSNPVIHDLYLIHEYFHTVYMTYKDNAPGYLEWSEKILNNELLASCFSEVVVYKIMPGLREVSFPFEIWYDSLKDQLDNMGDMQAKHFILEQRQSAYFKPKNEIEKEISLYYLSNLEWLGIWKENYPVLESIVAKSKELPNSEQGAYLLEKLSKYSTDGIPFKEEAILFKNRLEEIKHALQNK